MTLLHLFLDTGFSANAYIHKIDIVIEKVLIVTTVTNTLLGHKEDQAGGLKNESY